MAKKQKKGPVVLTFEYGDDKLSVWVLTETGAHKVHEAVEPLLDAEFVSRETVKSKPSRNFIREEHAKRFGSNDLEWSTRLDAKAA